jgi:hypothetical protein
MVGPPCGPSSFPTTHRDTTLNAVAQAADVFAQGMSGELYDVLVLGPVEATPTAEARLAAALAGLNGAPLTAIAQGLAEKNLSVGQGLDRSAAETLLRQLQTMGALTSIRRATSGFPQVSALTPPPQAFRTTATPASGPLQGLSPTSTPGSGLGPALGPTPSTGGSLGRPPLSSPGGERPPSTGQGLRPLGSLRPDSAAPAPGAAPAAGPVRVPTDGLGHRVPTGAGFNLAEPSSKPRGSARPMAAGAPTVAPPPSAADPFNNPEAGAGPLELDRNRKPGATHHRPDRPEQSVSGASGLFNPKLIATKAASGLDLAGSKQSTVERCPRHGLLYDSAKSSACRKCLTDGRAALGEGPVTLRTSPARRALLGLLFALVLGFLPAAYYARVPGAAEVTQLRAEQQELSKGLGNEKTIQRFDEIEELVATSRRLAMRNTLIIWIAASGLLIVVWYKAT